MIRPAPSSTLRLGYTGFVSEKISVWGRSGKATGGVPVIMVHGYQGSALHWYDPAVMDYTAWQIGAAGVTAIGSDCGGLSPWGNATMVTSIDNQISWAAANYGTRTDLVAFYLRSAGASALNWIWRNPSKLAGAALCIPAVSLQGLHDRDPGGIGIQASIDAAYTNHAGYVAALPTRDPSHVDNMAQLAPLASKIQIWYSGDDGTCIPAEVTAFAAGTGIVANNIGNVGHSMGANGVGNKAPVEWLIQRAWWPSN